MASKEVYVYIKDVDWRGKDAVDRLRNMRDRAQDFGPVLHWAKNHLERAYTKNFTTMGAMSAKAMLKGAWPPLDEEYAAWKFMHIPGAPPLVVTGGLFRSVASIGSSPKNVMTDMSAEFVVDNPIAKFHQFGTQDMPARKIVFVPRDFDRDIEKKTIQYVVEGSKIT
jgi:hypothetical protein